MALVVPWNDTGNLYAEQKGRLFILAVTLEFRGRNMPCYWFPLAFVVAPAGFHLISLAEFLEVGFSFSQSRNTGNINTNRTMREKVWPRFVWAEK